MQRHQHLGYRDIAGLFDPRALSNTFGSAVLSSRHPYYALF